MSAKTIAVISGGLSQPSSTRMLADRLAAATVKAFSPDDAPVTIHHIEVRDHAHAVVDANLTGFASPPLQEALDQVRNADAIIAVAPIFSASYSGLFKSFIDILDPDSLTERPVLLGATGGTARHSLALEHAMRPLWSYLRADVVPTAVFAATDDWAGADQDLTARIDRAGAQLAARLGAAPTSTPAAKPVSGSSSADLNFDFARDFSSVLAEVTAHRQ